MPDITMCSGKASPLRKDSTDCPIRETCYRYTATPYSRQSYFATPPVKPDGTCQYRMEPPGGVKK